jgi:hypothetical protein
MRWIFAKDFTLAACPSSKGRSKDRSQIRKARRPVRLWRIKSKENIKVKCGKKLLLSDQHEHLGQSIAYARVNGVVPPWSK